MWQSVDCKKRAVPEALLKKQVVKYVSKKFPDLKIVRVKKRSYGVEIGLSDGVALKFDRIGSYLGVAEIEKE